MPTLKTSLALMLVPFVLGSALPAADATYSPAKDTLVYVGTYTGPASKGIHYYRLQEGAAGQATTLAPLGLAAETPSPSFLHVDAKRHLLFAVNEVGTYEGKPGGSVSSFRIDPATGKLTLINTKPSGGAGPCHVTLDATGKNLFVANYDGGSISVIRVGADGQLGETTTFIQNKGSGPTPNQQSAHAHCVTIDAANKFVFVCDLGIDQVLIYRLDADKGTLTPTTPAFAALKPGSGPRHLTFRPDGRFAYVFNELAGTLTTFAYNAATGALTEVATVSSLPPGYEGRKWGAELATDAAGKFLYASNRARDAVAVFAIDPAKGTLSFINDTPSGGQTPRHFALLPSGRHMLVANQNSNNVLVSTVDAVTGKLSAFTPVAEVSAPVAIAFLPPAAK